MKNEAFAVPLGYRSGYRSCQAADNPGLLVAVHRRGTVAYRQQYTKLPGRRLVRKAGGLIVRISWSVRLVVLALAQVLRTACSSTGRRWFESAPDFFVLLSMVRSSSGASVREYSGFKDSLQLCERTVVQIHSGLLLLCCKSSCLVTNSNEEHNARNC